MSAKGWDMGQVDIQLNQRVSAQGLKATISYTIAEPPSPSSTPQTFNLPKNKKQKQHVFPD